MEWLRNRTMYLFTLAGALFGVMLLSLGIWLEFTNNHLPMTPWAFAFIHRTDPMIITLDLAPFLFGLVGCLIGIQRSLLHVIQKGKREWEFIFDAIPDPLLVVDDNDQILRCNRALVKRLDTTFRNVIGHNLAEIVQTDQRFDASLYSFTWLARTRILPG